LAVQLIVGMLLLRLPCVGTDRGVWSRNGFTLRVC